MEALEQSSGGECPRCSGVVGVFVAGELYHASRHGEAMTPEQWAEAFSQDGRCLVCGAEPVRIKVIYDGDPE
ncbi:MAG: hypothetical protein M3522_01470 [Actinomycetota bacterium]|nr:hypothetical protein [Actinomycetota bacterium]